MTPEERKARLDMLRAVLDKLTYPTDNPSGLADHCRWLLSEVERLEKEVVRLERYIGEDSTTQLSLLLKDAGLTPYIKEPDVDR